MAISLIGTPQAGTNLNAGSVSMTFDVAPQEGDVTILYGGFAYQTGQTTPAGPTDLSPGYTQIVSSSGVAGGAPEFGVWYKVQGSTPDTFVVGRGSQFTSHATTYGSFVLRGVNTNNIFDGTIASSSGATGAPNGGSVTTSFNNSWVIVFAGSDVNDTARGSITGWNILTGASGNDTTGDMSVEAAYSASVNPTTADPGAWSAWANSDWVTYTIGFREYVAPTAKPVFIQWLGSNEDY